MADLAFDTADVAAVKVFEQFTGPTDEAITPGQCVRFEVTSGYLTSAKATEAAEHGYIRGLAIGTANGSAITITAVKRGILNMGTGLGGLTYDDIVYLSNTDGALADTAGSVSIVVGHVIPGYGMGTAVPDKLLYVDM